MATGCRSLILRASLFGLWVLGKSRIPAISLLTLMTTSWWLMAIIAFKCSTRMATTLNPLERGSFLSPLVFAWIVREGLFSVKVKEFPSFRFLRQHQPHSPTWFSFSLLTSFLPSFLLPSSFSFCLLFVNVSFSFFSSFSFSFIRR